MGVAAAAAHAENIKQNDPHYQTRFESTFLKLFFALNCLQKLRIDDDDNRNRDQTFTD